MAALAGPSQSIFTKCPLCGALQAVPVIEAMVRKGRAQEGGVSAGSVGEEALSRVLKGGCRAVFGGEGGDARFKAGAGVSTAEA